MSKGRVLVTGGGGFIGSHLVDALLVEGYEVRVLDNFATGRRENLAHCVGDIDLREGDIRSVPVVESAVEGVDAILHEAALPSVPRSIEDPFTTNEVNVTGTLNLLSAAAKSGVSRIVLASSSSVYGDTEALPKHEDLLPMPMSPYAVTKRTGELYLRAFDELYGIDTLAMRYFNVFGPRQDPTSQYSGVVAKFMTAAVESAPFTVHGDGLQARDFTYIDNVVHANLLALTADRLGGAVANVACGGRYTLLDLIEAIRSSSGSDAPVIHGESRAGDVRYSEASIDRAREVLGYEPTVHFEQGVELTYQWYAG